ncbi:Protein of unknown function [Variovorax sp. HW608]|uniref:DUF1329 domain-containing protein n=1 Tax=Variovorax sp. HW608 TaxID=1034889 RepID=UPI00081FFB2C|nr:DUF1329 domain-containing protein [Variovorax sp. HW608]SCK14573.1 Protein of unknown function [Variovorax sp. HW608]
MYHTLSKVGIAALVGLAALSAQAGVSAEEAAKLKSELTPFGAERAGNKDDSIPAWTGGVAQSTAPAKGLRPDPFASEKPLFTITSKNMAQYADKLSEGSKAMLTKYPETFRMDVYPTHRTSSAPQWVYENTLRNATQATLVDGPAGPRPQGAFGGIPFPIPKSGLEVMWNHILRWRGESVRYEWKGYTLTTDGRWIMAVEAINEQTEPYYYKEDSAATHNGAYWLVRSVNSGPPIRAGEGILAREDIDQSKSQAWVYLTGQRRVRKLPNACCDTPTPFSAGVMTFDEVEVHTGRMDRFEWKLLGKRELLIPYNNNKAQSAKGGDAEVLGSARHLNPDVVRWELHRVWVVESTLKPGQRHTSPKSRYYVDEDNWFAALSDRWDANNQLARTGFGFTEVVPELPGAIGWTMGIYDLVSGAAYIAGFTADQKLSYRPVARQKDVVFSPDSLAAEGIR